MPHGLYVRFLLTKGLSELKDINAQLSKLHLRNVSQALVDSQFEVLKHVLPKYVFDQIEKKHYSKEFKKWMDKVEVGEMWGFSTESAAISTLVEGLLKDPKLTLSLNALLTKGCKKEEIAYLLNNKFSSMLKDVHIEVYEKFFFNPKRLTRSDWNAFLQGCSNTETKVYFIALTESVDTLKIDLGFPGKVHVGEALQYLFAKSFSKAKHYLNIDTQEGNKEARAWIEETAKLADKYEKYRSGDSDDFANQLQMEFEFDSTPFATPDDEVMSDIAARTRVVEEEPKKSE